MMKNILNNDDQNPSWFLHGSWCMFMVHVHGACSWCMFMVHVHGACAWCMCMVHVHGACAWCMCMVHVHGACAWCMVNEQKSIATVFARTGQ